MPKGNGRRRHPCITASRPIPAGPSSSDAPPTSSGAEAVPNLLAIGPEGGGVYLPAHVQAVSLPALGGLALHCASLPASATSSPCSPSGGSSRVDDEGLGELLNVAQDPDDGLVADGPEILTFARLALASNEAVRRDCPLWLVGGGD